MNVVTFGSTSSLPTGETFRLKAYPGQNSRRRVFRPAHAAGRNGRNPVNLEQNDSIADAPGAPQAENELIFVIDEDLSVREWLTELIHSLGLRVAAYSSAEEFLVKRPSNTSGCIILDVFLSGMSGLELQEELKAAEVDLPIIFFSGRGDIAMTVHALKAGAVNFLTRPIQRTEMAEALKEALAANRRTQLQKAEFREISQRFETLTLRERQVMSLVVSGLLNKQVAHEMGISERTVKLYRACVMQKMGVGSLAELVRVALIR